MRNKVWCVLGLLLCLSLGPGAFSQSAISVNKVPGSVESTARKLMHGLVKQGFEVSRGYFRLYTPDDCQYSFAVMKSCFGNNVAAPYILFSAPPWPDEFVDPATVNAFGLTKKGYSSTFRFDPREAIIVLGQLPPPAAYFGLQTYQFTRQGTYRTDSGPYMFFGGLSQYLLDVFFASVPNNSKRLEALASLSNSINNVVIERQSLSSFDQLRFFIITPDKFMDTAMRQAFGEIGIDQAKIFTEKIPSTMITGLDEAADDFISTLRYARPLDGGAARTRSDTWRKNLPLVVLRVRDHRYDRQPETYPEPVLEPRTAWDENQLLGDFNNLVAEVSRKWRVTCAAPDCPAAFLNMEVDPVDLVGPKCTPIGMNCVADTQDTIYQLSSKLPLDDGEVHAVVGVLSTETTNATYVSLAVNSTLMQKGIAEVSEERLKDTALEFGGVVNNAGKFFVYYFTRDCQSVEPLTGNHCFEIPKEMIPVCSDPATCDRLGLSLRAYMRPGTQRGPDAARIMPAVIITVKRK